MDYSIITAVDHYQTVIRENARGDSVQVAAAVSTSRRTIAGWSLRWDEERARQAYASGLWVRETLGQALSRAAAEEPDRVLVIDAVASVDARTLHSQASALAGAMVERYPEGSVISFMLPNWHEAATVYMAATMAGMVAHPVLPSLREHELRFMLQDVNSRMIFIPSQFRGKDYGQLLSKVMRNMDHPPDAIVVRGENSDHLPFPALVASSGAATLPAPEADAVRMVMYTSGTTGSPKGVMHSHNSIHALIRQLGDNWLLEPGDSFLVASPISHIGGSIYAFECPLLLGTTAVLMEQWDADAAAQSMLQHRCTHFAGATPFLEQTLAAGRRADTRFPDLKVFICGGASVPPTLIRDASDYFDKAVVTRVYGSTEVPVTTVGVLESKDVAHAAETDGRAGIAEIKLVNESGAVAETGEVLARGPQMLVGYVHPEDEATVFDAEGYYRTGDLGRWQDGDYLVIDGRIKDIIIRNGENIAPKEIEDLLVGHPDIAEIAIVGIPDPATGERACAVIVAGGEHRPSVSDLFTYLDERGVAKFKIPEQVAIWDALPRNDAGKVLKHRIRETLTAQ